MVTHVGAENCLDNDRPCNAELIEVQSAKNINRTAAVFSDDLGK